MGNTDPLISVLTFMYVENLSYSGKNMKGLQYQNVVQMTGTCVPFPQFIA